MQKFLNLLIIVVFFISCSPKYLSSDTSKEISKICLNFDGNGRLSVQGHKYVFSAETLLDEKENKWVMGMSFPMHGQELIELDLNQKTQAKFTEKIQEKVLREKSGINPADLELFMTRWADFLNNVIAVKRRGEAPSKDFRWTLNKKMMMAQSKVDDSKEVEAKFYNPTEDHFSRMDFFLKSKEEDKQIKIELIVRKCLDK